MSNKKFTEVEINHLQANSYVLEATPSTVHFSAEFKAKFWNASSEGATPREIVASMGIDPDVLGSSRLSGLKGMIRNEVRAGKGFRDLNTYKTGINDFMTLEAKIEFLEQKIAYKDQEIEFLKKLYLWVRRSQKHEDSCS